MANCAGTWMQDNNETIVETADLGTLHEEITSYLPLQSRILHKMSPLFLNPYSQFTPILCWTLSIVLGKFHTVLKLVAFGWLVTFGVSVFTMTRIQIQQSSLILK
jgi:hypothetical protein